MKRSNLLSYCVKSKLRDKSFIEIVTKHSIILLTEAWLRMHDTVNIPGYKHMPVLGPNKRSKRGHRGVSVLFQQSIVYGIEILETEIAGLIWLKLSKLYFGFENDIFFTINIYTCIPPENSVIHNDLKTDFFARLNNYASKYSLLVDIIISGDFNGRTANLSDTLVDNNISRFTEMPIQRFFPQIS